MPSMPASWRANLAGAPRRASTPAYGRQCNGTSTIPNGLKRSPAVRTGTGLTGTTRKEQCRHARCRMPEAAQDEGNYSRRRIRNTASPGDQGHLEAAFAGVRQADDLLPALHAYAGGHPRDPHHLHTAGYASLRTPPGRWNAVGDQDRVRRSTVARWFGASLSHRQGVPRG